MTPYDIIAQAIGIVAMCFNIFSFQLKSPTKVILCQLFGATLFAVHFFMLGAIVGALMNVIAVLRAIVYSNPKRFRAEHIVWLVVFIALYIASYILTFTVFEKAFTVSNAVLEILPVIALIASTVGFRLQRAKAIRATSLISSPCWLVYNIVNVAIGAILCEAFSIVSIIIGIIRLDLKKKN